MPFSNPIQLTIDGATVDLVRVNSDNRYSEYQYTSSTSSLSMLIRNTRSKPDTLGRVTDRHTISLRQTVFATETASEKVRQAQMTITHPMGDDASEYDDLAIAVAGLIDSANVMLLNNQES